MPSSANENILRRELSVAGAKPITEIGNPLLIELINYGTHAFLRCATSEKVKGVEDIDLAPIALYRQMIELTDGIQALTLQSIGNPSFPILRSLFEAFLSLEFILQSGANYQQRSVAWLVGYARERLNSHKQLSLKTTQGQQFKTYWESDSIASKIKLPFSEAQINKAIANMEAFLNKPHVQPVNLKFDEYKNERKRNPNWFSIDGGPNTIEELSARLNRGGLYNVLYRHWSSISHATDLLSFIAPKDKRGKSGIRGLRDAKDLKDIYTFAASFMIEATRKILIKFRPGEEEAFRKWYTNEVKDRYIRMTKLKVEISYS